MATVNEPTIMGSIPVEIPAVVIPQSVEIRKEVTLIRDKAVLLESISTSAISVAQDLVVNNEESLAIATQESVDLVPHIKELKTLKSRMDVILAPVKSKIKSIDDYFKSILTPMESADTIYRSKILQYRNAQQELQRQVDEVLKEDGELPPPHTFVAPVTEQKSVRVDGGMMSFSKVWTFKIVKIAEIDVEVLRQVVNTKKGMEALESTIRMHVKAGKRQMGGVQIFQTEQPSVRR